MSSADRPDQIGVVSYLNPMPTLLAQGEGHARADGIARRREKVSERRSAVLLFKVRGSYPQPNGKAADLELQVSASTLYRKGVANRLASSYAEAVARLPEEPYAVVPLVRICAGGCRQGPSLPRPVFQPTVLPVYRRPRVA